jgi:hypothetical protein
MHSLPGRTMLYLTLLSPILAFPSAAVHGVARTLDHGEYQWTCIPAVAETKEAAEACAGGQTQPGAGRVQHPARAPHGDLGGR